MLGHVADKRNMMFSCEHDEQQHIAHVNEETESGLTLTVERWIIIILGMFMHGLSGWSQCLATCNLENPDLKKHH